MPYGDLVLMRVENKEQFLNSYEIKKMKFGDFIFEFGEYNDQIKLKISIKINNFIDFVPLKESFTKEEGL